MDEDFKTVERWLKERYPNLDPGRQRDVAIALICFVDDDHEVYDRLWNEAGILMDPGKFQEVRAIARPTKTPHFKEIKMPEPQFEPQERPTKVEGASIQWAPQQQQALNAVRGWMSAGARSPVFRLFGYAGTGKTTLAKHFARELEGLVLFGAYTGKAALVMQQKGCTGASTLHSLIYKPVEAEDDESKRPRIEFVWNANSDLQIAELLIVDECSMVDNEMAEDLLRFDVPVLALGDPAQLPPVKGTGYFTSAKPDFLLTDIHRQAQESNIVKLAHELRNGETALGAGLYGDVEIIDEMHLTPEQLLAADQVLVGMNKTRKNLNHRIRQLRGYTHNRSLPCKGERLVCLKNNRDRGLINGGIWYAEEDAELRGQVVHLHVRSEDHHQRNILRVHASHFDPAVPENDLAWKLDEMTFGHALTVHKAQGSQWDHVLVINESSVFRENASKWAYTAVTRAAKKLVLVI